ncbi:MAG: YVTN family beta-propeller repeat protein [Candidatus Anammoxibacter sp.]
MYKKIIPVFVAFIVLNASIVVADTDNKLPVKNLNNDVAEEQGVISGDGYKSRFVKSGVAIDFSVSPFLFDGRDRKVVSVSSPDDMSGSVSDVHVGDEVVISFLVTDAYTGAPIKGLLPDSFLQYKPNAKTPDQIKAAIDRGTFRAFKRGRMNNGHPSLLENTYVMCLNSLDNSISVINPLQYPETIVKKLQLDEKCVDLGLAEYGSDLYITCESGKIIIVDCNRLDVVKRIDVGRDPFHIEFQPDGHYVWIGNDGDGTVSVIDAGTRSVVKNIKTGKGHHEITFSKDGFHAYVTNNGDDSVTIIDINSLATVKTLKTGIRPHGLVYSNLSQCVYIANEGSGTISVLDTAGQEIVHSIIVGKGVRALAFDEKGRLCFALNRMDNSVSIIDISRNKVIKTIPTGIRPESIVISPDHVFIRNVGSPDVTVIKLKDLSSIGEIQVGELPPNSVEISKGHLDIGNSYMVIIPNPTDNIVYTLMHGDTETSFKYKTKGKGPTKVAFFWIGLKETLPGLYTRVARFDKPGHHEVGFYIDSPELATCFGVNVLAPNDG